MVYFFELDDRLRKPVEAKAGQEKAEGGDHGDDAEVGGRQQARQDDCADHLGRERKPRGGNRSSGAPNGEASQFVASSYRAEGATSVKWGHSSCQSCLSLRVCLKPVYYRCLDPASREAWRIPGCNQIAVPARNDAARLVGESVGWLQVKLAEAV